MDIEQYQRTTRIMKEDADDQWHAVGFATLPPKWPDLRSSRLLTQCDLTITPRYVWLSSKALPTENDNAHGQFPDLCATCLHSIWKELTK